MDNTVAPTGRPTLQREISKEDFDAETFFMQKEIDNLKDVLSGQITLDSSLISNLFNPNEPLYFAGKDPMSNIAAEQKLPLEMEVPEAATNEPPSFFELADIEGNDDELMMPPPPQVGANKDNFSSLETPLILEEALELDANPLVAQIQSKTKKGRKKN